MMTIKSMLITLFCFGYSIALLAQTSLSTVNQATYDNYEATYNYTYWNENWRTQNTGNHFSVLTSAFYLNIDYDNLNISSLLINNENLDTETAFKALDAQLFDSDYNATIDYAILQNDGVAYAKSATPTSRGANDSQMAKYGTWYNTRFVSTHFTNSPPITPYHTGIEFSNWHDRLQLVFHLKPTADITNGQLQFSFEIPDAYATVYENGTNTFGFASAEDQGFVVKAGQNAATITRQGNTITVTSAVQDFLADMPYELGLVVVPIREDLSQNYETIFQKDEPVNTTYYNTTAGTEITSSDWKFYDADENVHYFQLPNTNMGYVNCARQDILYEQDLTFENTADYDKTVKVCVFKDHQSNITGFNSLLCNQNGDPAGLPIQVSKNWHGSKDQLFIGFWYYGYFELIVPANTTLHLKHRETAAKWGETYSASSHQLSVVGSGIPRGGWLEAALGTFGENITHSPDYEFGSSNGCDLRPFLVTNEAYGGTSSECSWTGNVGGLDMFVYQNTSGAKVYQSEVKTRFKKYSPNLTETAISALSSDHKLKFDYTFYLNRSDDFTRVYYKLHLEALEATDFSRFDLFQLGGDIYNVYSARSVVYGDTDGVVGTLTPSNSGSNDYTTDAIALTGTEPWLWAGDGIYYTGAANEGGISIDTNNAMILRDYSASFGGTSNNTPYFRERSSSGGFSGSRGTNPTSYCIVPPPAVTSFAAGDTMDLLVEVVVQPKQQTDYYGPNTKFAEALGTFGNTYELLYREAQGNRILASSPTHAVNTTYPLTVTSTNDSALVAITGGKGYVPVVFSGLTQITNPTLWKAHEGCWEVVDQSVHGKDFWQAEYVEATQDFNLIYNVNQDNATDDASQTIYYYLGATPPAPELIVQSLIVGGAWSSNAEVAVTVDADSVTLAPQVRENGTISVATDQNYQWTLPDNTTHTGRVLQVSPVTEAKLGDYSVTYTNAYGCTDTVAYTLSAATLSSERFDLKENKIRLYPNPVVDFLQSDLVLQKVAVYDVHGKLLLTFENTQRFDLSTLASGLYFVKITYEDSTYIKRIIK